MYAASVNKAARRYASPGFAMGLWSKPDRGEQSDRREEHQARSHNGLLPLPVAPSQDAEMAWPTQVSSRFAPTTGRAPRY
jgi:hypothetical protein